ncbi:MAG TPA: zinc ribbon domain-containing protein [Chloroflexia bacterium]|nr:zinc ribbon domain-containing protein [Chloroflexia bacterium]
MNCPRCGAPNEPSTKFCMNCGLPLAPAEGARPASDPEAAGSRAGASVVRHLLPARMPKGSFWAGLSLVIAGAVFGFCTAATSLALLLGSGAGLEGLLVSACGLAVLVVPGIALLLAGRPRAGA